MDCAYTDDDDKHSSSCYTSSSSSSSSSSMEEEHYAIDKDDGLIEEPATKPLPEASSKSNQIPMSNKPAGYDPHRIPSSVFAGKPSSAMDWSVASNESLFSIHVGNNSFSRDQNFVVSNKSGELGLTPLSPVTETAETNKGSSNAVEFDHCSETSDGSVQETESVETVRSIVEKDSTEAPEENKESRGVLSSQSFQFPVLLSHHDHHEQVKHILDQAMKEEKRDMLAPGKQKSDPEFESPENTLVPLTAAQTGSWISFILCCWICQ